MTLPRVILLDLDDTILALSESGEACWRQVCSDFVSGIPGMTAERLFEGIGQSRHHFWQDRERHRRGRMDLRSARREMVLDAFRQMEIDRPQLADELADSYTERRAEMIWALPGAIETLGNLRGAGVRLGLITNGASEGQRYKIERFDLERFFEVIVIEGEFGVGKPDPAVYQYALQALGVPPKEAWMVGDNLEWDVQGAQAVGIFAVWVDWRGVGLPQGSVHPDRIVRSISELISADNDPGPGHTR